MFELTSATRHSCSACNEKSAALALNFSAFSGGAEII